MYEEFCPVIDHLHESHIYCFGFFLTGILGQAFKPLFLPSSTLFAWELVWSVMSVSDHLELPVMSMLGVHAVRIQFIMPAFSSSPHTAGVHLSRLTSQHKVRYQRWEDVGAVIIACLSDVSFCLFHLNHQNVPTAQLCSLQRWKWLLFFFVSHLGLISSTEWWKLYTCK